MSRIVALDLGEISMGVAISDEMKIIPTPLENYMFERDNFEQAKERLEKIIRDFDVELILLGYPKRTDGQKSDMTIKVENFYEEIKDLGPRVKLLDETYSTKDGIEMLSTTIKDKEKIKALKDVAAAFILLKSYLELI